MWFHCYLHLNFQQSSVFCYHFIFLFHFWFGFWFYLCFLFWFKPLIYHQFFIIINIAITFLYFTTFSCAGVFTFLLLSITLLLLLFIWLEISWYLKQFLMMYNYITIMEIFQSIQKMLAWDENRGRNLMFNLKLYLPQQWKLTYFL